MKIREELRKTHFSLRAKLTVSFLAVVLAGGLIYMVIAIRLIGDTVIRQAQNKVRHDLSSAWMVYNETLKTIKDIVRLTADRFFLQQALAAGQLKIIQSELERVRKTYGLDVLTLTEASGRVVVRSRSPYTVGDNQANDDLVSRALAGKVVAATQIVPAAELRREGEGLERQAYFRFKPTPLAKPRPEIEETSGMMLKAAAPVVDEKGKVIGALYGGVLLNRNYEIVDAIKKTVYKGERYQGKDIGTATIFQWDLRISTNVQESNGLRAIGTRASAEVYDAVLENGKPWIGRAFVVNDWYITAYEPIQNIRQEIIGMLYVGILEQPYLEMKKNIIWTVLKFIALGIVGVFGLAYLLERRIVQPLLDLVRATEEISRGRFPREVETASKDEIGTLAASFNRMTAYLKQTLEEKDRAYEELKDLSLRYLELLGFATHELIQPLGVLKGYLVMMQNGLSPSQQRQAVSAMLRNVNALISMSQKYLQLSRIESGELEVHKENVRVYEEVLQPILEDERPQLQVKGMQVEVQNEDAFRRLEIAADPTLLRIVYSNLITNAIKYGRPNGRISCGFVADQESCRFYVWNEGPGIPPDKLEAVFEKFRRLEGTARKQRGTGLGLFNSREIIRRHGGDMWAESVEGEWANFIFTLPWSVPDQETKEGPVKGGEQDGKPTENLSH